MMFCIAGADGFFGAYLQRELLRHSEKILALNHRGCVFPDSENLKNLQFESTDDKCIDRVVSLLRDEKEINIIYLIACHNPDIVKKDPDKAEYINHICYEKFLKAIQSLDIRTFYYASSDTVYGESLDNEVFTEQSPLCPVNVYGEQKKKAEEITRKYGYSVVRFPYMYAPSLNSKKHFFDEILSSLRQGEQMELLSDYIRSSVTYKTAAEYLYKLIKTDTDEKVINICADKPTSKFDIGLCAALYTDAEASLIESVTMESFEKFTEKRAGSIMMSNALLKNILGETKEIIFNDLTEE